MNKRNPPRRKSFHMFGTRTSAPLVKVIQPIWSIKSDRVNLVASASPIECLLILTQSPGDTVQTGTGKVDPARNFKCTTAARD